MGIQPKQTQKALPKVNRRIAAGGGLAVGAAAMLAIATPVVALWEGKRNDPYLDIVGVLTVCYGETRNIERRWHSNEECTAMLQEGLGDFGEAVAERNPELRDNPQQWAAATSLAYNIGKRGYARSTVARRFSQGRWLAACDAFRMWRMAGGRVVRGLVRRRAAEREICLTNMPKRYKRN